jgi:chromosome segregation ATPase
MSDSAATRGRTKHPSASTAEEGSAAEPVLPSASSEGRDRAAEIAVLEQEIDQLRARSAAFAARNGELEFRLSAATVEIDKLRAADAGECAELRQRIKTLTEHLDAADGHVASMRSRIDQLSSESTRNIARLERRLGEKEKEFAAQSEHLSSSFATETATLRKRVEELETANERLSAEARLATATGARQRQSLEARVGSLLGDIEELKNRHAEAIGDRDRSITSLRQDIESIKSVAAVEKSQLRQSLADTEMTRQRDAAQHAKIVDGLRATLAAAERDSQSVRDTAAAERRRLEAVLADERDRARRQLDARDEQRRSLQARAEAAEKQASGARETAMLEIARANQLEQRLSAERANHAAELEALHQHGAALAAQLEADRNSSALIVEELRRHLAEAVGEEAANGALSATLDHRDAAAAEIEALRARVTELEAQAAPRQEEIAPPAGVRTQIAEVLSYARDLDQNAPDSAPDEAAAEDGSDASEEAPNWGRHLMARLKR